MPTTPSLSSRRWGDINGPEVVLVHGFTQTSRSWTPVAELLARHGASVVGVDLPGHGGSGAAVVADLWEAGETLTSAAIAALRQVDRPSLLVGYSLGGRVTLHAALRHPERWSGLVLIGATAGIDDPIERETRREADDRLADEIMSTGVDAFLAKWLAQPLFATLRPDAASLEDRRSNTAAGLASSLRTCGTGGQEPLWDRLGSLEVPVTVIAGSLDAKFSALGERLCRALPNAHLRLVSGAGHACHLENPTLVSSLIIDALSSTTGKPSGH